MNLKKIELEIMNLKDTSQVIRETEHAKAHEARIRCDAIEWALIKLGIEIDRILGMVRDTMAEMEQTNEERISD